ncbi:hypothetical protein Acr_24g0002050 [Actinidia rufa]|uniref:Uncharacterized protein n=1 Tax=Actinidia rufa TaxID=165716 RepID=A0A7J0GT44_9ERIC|nr:hypothetical protein Acr_24g0002050 [Actinidia rufa]
MSCPVIPGIKEALHGQVNAIGHYGQGVRSPYSNTYNPGWRDHSNFGWRNKGTSNPQVYQGGFHNPQSYQTPPPPSQPQNYQPSLVTSFPTPPKPFQQPPQAQSNTYLPHIKGHLRIPSNSLCKLKKKKIQGLIKALDDIKSQLTLLTQAWTLTEKGKLPAQPQSNTSRHVHSIETSNQPSSSHEKVQAITVLRSGKAIDKTILSSDPKGRKTASKVAEGAVERESLMKRKGVRGAKRGGKSISKMGMRRGKEENGSVPKGDEVLSEEREILTHAPFPHLIAKSKNNLSFEIYETRLNVRESAFLAKNVHSVVQVKKNLEAANK